VEALLGERRLCLLFFVPDPLSLWFRLVRFSLQISQVAIVFYVVAWLGL
jgi:hypothetical protein